MIVNITNPTLKAKAVLVKGGHAIVGPGESVDIDVSFGEVRAKAYEAAGLVFAAATPAGTGATVALPPVTNPTPPTGPTPPKVPDVKPVSATPAGSPAAPPKDSPAKPKKD